MRLVKALVVASVAAIAVSLAWMIIGVVLGLDEIIIATSSGGLGAVSFGLSEALLEAGVVTFVVVFVWRVRRSKRAGLHRT